MSTRIKAYRGISIVFSLIGLGLILVSVFANRSEHNYALAIGLCSTAAANFLNSLANREKQKQ
jgi:uncharacterized membrane protein YhhN